MAKKQQREKTTLSASQPKFRPLDRRYDIENYGSIDTGVLGTFSYEYPGKDVVIDIETNEFTAVCPWSGLPDYGVVRVSYIPGKLIIELRSFKYYLLSYRNVGIYQEHVVHHVLNDLAQCVKPKWMRVAVDYNIRGGVHTVASAEFGKKK